MNDQMQVDLIRDVNRLQTDIDSQKRPEVSRLLVNPFLDLPGKVGLWYAGDVQRSTGNIYDRSMQGRTLTYAGNPTFNQLSNGIAYCDYDGTGDYHSRPDETDLDILGTETIYISGARGLTYGGWFNFASLAATTTFLGKRGGGPGSGFAYFLQYDNGASEIRNYVSVDGTALTNVGTSFSTTDAWVFIVARFVPGTSLDLWINGIKTTNTTSIPASIINNTGDFAIGAFTGGTEPMTGRYSIAFLSANNIPDGMINRWFNATRVLYGV